MLEFSNIQICPITEDSTSRATVLKPFDLGVFFFSLFFCFFFITFCHTFQVNPHLQKFGLKPQNKRRTDLFKLFQTSASIKLEQTEPENSRSAFFCPCLTFYHRHSIPVCDDDSIQSINPAKTQRPFEQLHSHKSQDTFRLLFFA